MKKTCKHCQTNYEVPDGGETKFCPNCGHAEEESSNGCSQTEVNSNFSEPRTAVTQTAAKTLADLSDAELKKLYYRSRWLVDSGWMGVIGAAILIIWIFSPKGNISGSLLFCIFQIGSISFLSIKARSKLARIAICYIGIVGVLCALFFIFKGGLIPGILMLGGSVSTILSANAHLLFGNECYTHRQIMFAYKKRKKEGIVCPDSVLPTPKRLDPQIDNIVSSIALLFEVIVTLIIISRF